MTTLHPPGELFEYSLTIREGHLDTFGHVNNAAYAQIFEEARWELITERGFGLEEIKRSRLGPVILAMDFKFKREVLNRERVRITTRCTGHAEKIGWLEQVLYNQQGEAACLAKFSIGLMDLEARRLVPPTPEWRRAIGLA
ncbi:MAG TPA: acyl-CoA thioesterase [Elusimicrobiota bacterium]|nr:acyl-CoA thioesterase [Elusimicrobiota bacterium]